MIIERKISENIWRFTSERVDSNEAENDDRTQQNQNIFQQFCIEFTTTSELQQQLFDD